MIIIMRWREQQHDSSDDGEKKIMVVVIKIDEWYCRWIIIYKIFYRTS